MPVSSNHTTSPWKWSDSYRTFDGRPTWSLIGPNGYGILSCDGVQNSPQGLGPDGEDYARLIAATPVLVEALDGAPIASQYHGPHGFDSDRFLAVYETFMARRRAALALARGEG